MKILQWLVSLPAILLASVGLADSPVLSETEQAVVVYFTYGLDDLTELAVLEEKLEEAIEKAGTGEFDGNEVATDGSDGYLYMYGPDADRLFDTIKPILKSTSFMRGAKVTKRYGPPDDNSKESVVVI